jgi:integrase
MPHLPTQENAIRGLKAPAGKAQAIFRDATVKGLGLRVGAKSKVWVADHKDAAGARRLATLGAFPAMGLREARAAAQAVIGGNAIGIDLVAERDARKAAQKKHAVETVGFWWERYDAEHVAHLRDNSQRSIRGAITDLLAVAEDVPVTEITPGHVREAMERRRARGAAKSTFHARNTAVGFFKFLIEREVLQFNPASAVRSPKRNRGQRVLTDGELQDLLRLLGTGEVTANARDVIYFTMLTGRRIGEVVGLRFADVDRRAATMTLREESDKQGLERLFPLPDAALAIVNDRRRLTNGEYVFQGVRQDKPPTQSLAAIPLRKLLGSAKWKHRHFTLHDLRRTYRTLASRLGVRFEVAELLLGHSLPGVHGTYDRHTYQPEMAAAAKLIAEHIIKLAPKGVLA